LAYLNLSFSKRFLFDQMTTHFESSFVSLPILSWISVLVSQLITLSSLVIQLLRIHAIYGQNKRMKIFLCCLFLATIGCSVALYVRFPIHLHREGSGPPNFSLYPQWFMILSFSSESILLGLVLYKVWNNRKFGYHHNFSAGGSSNTSKCLLTIMVRDSVKFYIAIFIIYGTSLVLIFVGRSEDSFSNPLFSNAPILFVSTGIVGTLSPRLILNLRREYYVEIDLPQGPIPSLPRFSERSSLSIAPTTTGDDSIFHSIKSVEGTTRIY